jgi:hypothetical protein
VLSALGAASTALRARLAAPMAALTALGAASTALGARLAAPEEE